MVNFLGALGTGATIAITIRAIDDFSKTFKKLGTGIGKIQLLTKATLAGIVGVGAALTAFGISSIKVAADFEQTQIAFTTMLGSAERAEKLLKDLADFAKKTPFTLTGVEASSKQLIAMGIEVDELLPTLKSLGDVSAGLSVPLDRLALNFGQVRIQGKLTGRELRDFAIAGVPLVSELAKNLNVSESAIAEMVSAGDIGFDKVARAFETMTSEGGKFFNLMDKQSESAAGKFSNFQDSIELLQREMGVAFLPVLKELADTLVNDVLPAIAPLIPELGENMAEVVKKLAALLDKELIDKITELAEQMIDMVPVLVDSLIPAFIEFVDVLEKLLPLITKVLEKVNSIDDLAGKIGTFSKIAGALTGNPFAIQSALKIKKVDDAIIKPNGQIIETAPGDTIIATKNPGGISIHIENIFGVDSEDISRSMVDTLNTKTRI